MIKRRFKALSDAAIGGGAVGLIRAFGWTDRRHTADFAGALMRRIGPLLREHRIGRDNLHAAFADKSDAEIEQILAGVWDNLGRVAVEFAHLDEFRLAGTGAPTANEVVYSPQTRARADRILHGGRAVIGFAAHLANWELPAVCTRQLISNSAVLYRRPNIGVISDLVVKLRTPLMGELVAAGLDAPVRMARLLQSGVHVGLLVDQFFIHGVEVTFFGRSCRTNPLAAVLARQTECPLHGVRVVRLADRNRFSVELTDAIEPARDLDGRVNVQGTMQRITSVVEDWVHEHPEQWLWLHRRWRPPEGRAYGEPKRRLKRRPIRPEKAKR